MYSTAGHRQKHQTKQNPQQAAQNQPTEAQKKTSSIFKIGNSQSEKIN
jgi:hypothetical protein